MDDLPLAFAVHRQDAPALEVVVNFGVLAGRSATPAEIDRLAEWLLDELDSVSIVSEDRHEIGQHGEAAVQQVRVEIPGERLPRRFPDRRALEQRLVERASHWARLCASDRHADLAAEY